MASRRQMLGATLFPVAARQIFAPIVLLILLLSFYVEGPLWFGSLWNSNMQFVISAYLFITLAAFVIAPALDQIKGPGPPPQKLFSKPPAQPLWAQALMYVGVALAVNVPLYLVGARTSDAFASLTAGNWVSLVALEVAVSGAEELFFRGALFRTGVLVSSVTFGAFHALVYGLLVAPLVVAIVAAVAFYYVYTLTKDSFGAAANTGAHLGYNSGLLGVSLLPASLIAGNPLVHLVVHAASAPLLQSLLLHAASGGML